MQPRKDMACRMLFAVATLMVISTYTRAEEERCYPNPPTNLENGKVWCNNSNKLDSFCVFMCEPYHTLIGENTTKCIKTRNIITWTESNPVCEADRCNLNIKSFPNGEFACSRENKVTSVCHYKCTKPGTSMFENMNNTNRCLPSKEWDSKPPCCQEPCPSHARVDVAIIMDSSSSVGYRYWELTMAFVKTLIKQFPVNEGLTRFAFFRYNNEVDEETAVRLEDHDKFLDGLLYRMNNITYNGSGTMTGKALRYAKEVIFSSDANRKDARDLIILITDGRSMDETKQVSIDFRKEGGKIIVLAIKRRRGYDGEYDSIAGDPANVINVDGYEHLNDGMLLNRLISKICNDFCINIKHDYQ